MLVVDRRNPDGSWPDSVDPELTWALPGGVEICRDATGSPRFLLARWGDHATGTSGGLLRFELDVLPPAQAGARAVAFSAVRRRTVLRSTGTQLVRALGEWRETPPVGAPLVAVVETLDAAATQLIEEGLEGSIPALEVQIEGVAHGLAEGIPALVVVAAARLAGLVGSEGVTVDEIAAGLLSFPAREVSVIPMEGLPVPSREIVMTELAHRVAGCLTVDAADVWEERRYHRPPEPVPEAYDLRVNRIAEVRFAASWSALDLAGSLTSEERDKAFPRLDGASPFGIQSIVVANAVPIDEAAGVRSVQVNVVTTGPAGLPERRSFRFDGAASTARFDAVHPAWLGPPTAPVAQAQAVLAPVPGADPPWPRAVPERPVPVTGSLVTVTAHDLGLGLVSVAVTPDAAALAGSFTAAVTVGGEAVAGGALRTDAPTYLAYPQGADALLAVVADQTEILRRPLTEPAALVSIAASDLRDLDPLRISVTLGEGSGAAFVAITLDDGVMPARSFTLEPGLSVTWVYHRSLKTAPIRYRWQLHWVPVAEDGATSPLASTEWTEGTELRMTVFVPEREEK
ncbi:MAG TPA: hypothetical protein PKE40_04005 [Arachnia sp.]|nr:hypothetical protein [Arachnia sp.]HMT85495.1 hypothetical protein [Arachnia sp.]